MKKVIIVLLLLTIAGLTDAQKTFQATNEFTINGFLENPTTISFSDLKKGKVEIIGDIRITNHLGEFKKEYKNVKGVHLMDFLGGIKLKSDSPKSLSEFYFVFTASDGYSVVASWNELFNTEIGNGFYLVTEADGMSMEKAGERILLISTKDIQTGRRHVRGLKTIEVKRI